MGLGGGRAGTAAQSTWDANTARNRAGGPPRGRARVPSNPGETLRQRAPPTCIPIGRKPGRCAVRPRHRGWARPARHPRQRLRGRAARVRPARSGSNRRCGSGSWNPNRQTSPPRARASSSSAAPAARSGFDSGPPRMGHAGLGPHGDACRDRGAGRVTARRTCRHAPEPLGRELAPSHPTWAARSGAQAICAARRAVWELAGAQLRPESTPGKRSRADPSGASAFASNKLPGQSRRARGAQRASPGARGEAPEPPPARPRPAQVRSPTALGSRAPPSPYRA